MKELMSDIRYLESQKGPEAAEKRNSVVSLFKGTSDVSFRNRFPVTKSKRPLRPQLIHDDFAGGW
jgi:hypothetical protein